MTMHHIIELVVGDWSGDGHCQTATHSIRSNLSKKEILYAYEKGQKISGIGEICTEYEDALLSKEALEKLLSLGVPVEIFNDEIEEDGIAYISVDEYVFIYLFIAGLGEPHFKYEFVEKDHLPHINIGGYGLFS